ncbi:hypothetical protein D3C76_920520 [compost metagenome]
MHGLLGGIQALVQGRDAGVFQPGRTLDTLRACLAANLFKLHQVLQTNITITSTQGQARHQHMANDHSIRRAGVAGL